MSTVATSLRSRNCSPSGATAAPESVRGLPRARSARSSSPDSLPFLLACNILDKLPKSLHAKAKSQLHEIWMSASREDAYKAFDYFVKQYQAKYPKATECLQKDKEELLTFYDFPAEHWKSLRTTNPIESTFATVRHRTKKAKGCFSRNTILTMVFKLCQSAENSWIRLCGFERLGDVINGIQFVDGIKKEVLVSDDEVAA